jgi:hypothetical protein
MPWCSGLRHRVVQQVITNVPAVIFFSLEDFVFARRLRYIK